MSWACTPFGRLDVVRAARGVDVMVARPPAEPGRIDPPLDLEDRLLDRSAGARLGHREPPSARVRLGAPPELHVVLPGRQGEQLTVVPVHLRMKGEIRGETLRLGGIDAALRISNDEARHRGLAGLVSHPPAHGHGRPAGEPDRHSVAVPVDRRHQRAFGPHKLERQLRVAVAGVAAGKLEDPILERESAQGVRQRLAIERHQFQPPRGDFVRRCIRERQGLRAAPRNPASTPAALCTFTRNNRQPCWASSGLAGPSATTAGAPGWMVTPRRQCGSRTRWIASTARRESVSLAALPIACLSEPGRGAPR